MGFSQHVVSKPAALREGCSKKMKKLLFIFIKLFKRQEKTCTK